MIGTEPWYATREDVKAALDFKATARSDARIDRALAGASRSVDGLCHRRFYPVTDTRRWDWPNGQYARSWRLWLDDSELIDLTALESGGVTIPTGDVVLEPNRTGPPYRSLSINLSSPSAFQAGDTEQQAIGATGLWGYRNTEAPASSAAGGVDAAAVRLPISDAGAAGVGSVLRAGAERLLVTGRSMADTGQTLQAAVTQSAADTVLTLGDTGALHEDEVLLVGGERMLVVDIAGASAVVRRAWDGSVLAAHAEGDPVYAARTLHVARGVLGTTAGPVADGAALVRWVPPELVNTYTIALAVTTLTQEPAGYARTGKSSSSRGSSTPPALTSSIDDLRDQCYAKHGRKARTRAV
ncbi:hypothetical protein [Streptomyces sp. CA-111067]|uniref:hypothetical protein n=1 Tax=Streptomyces sp. CA-111067 TaxID=3240046 RepID=UPI003D97C84E